MADENKTESIAPNIIINVAPNIIMNVANPELNKITTILEWINFTKDEQRNLIIKEGFQS